MTTVGFDFGTTNSLVSHIDGNRPISHFDGGLPIPSVVCYEGGDIIVGKEAKDRLEDAGLGVYGNIVRSPKILLQDDSVYVDGVERSTIDVVADVIKGVKRQTLGRRSGRLDSLDSAVVTIPVTFEGQRRAKLREAFSRAGIRIVQYVHEPLAALYGYFRSAGGVKENLRRYDRRHVLVFDWGGGTLDLTLCRIENGMILQIANDGSDEVGGDRFDDALRNEVIRLGRDAQSVSDSASIHPDANARLLQKCERAKIDLSERDSVQVYVDHFFRDVENDALDFRATRHFLEEATKPIVDAGTDRVDRLLEAARLSHPQIGLCLATGGMVNMPAIQSRLHERFGPQRVRLPESGAGAISVGAAWIAHDKAGLRLAKTVELALARQSYLPLLKADTKMPMQGDVCGDDFDLYCVDPRDGFAKFEIVSPKRPGRLVRPNDIRKVLATMTVKIDSSAKPFRERLQMRVEVDENLILHTTAVSLMNGHRDHGEIHDLEFCVSVGMDGHEPANEDKSEDEPQEDDEPAPKGAVTLRPNVASSADPMLVPGELRYEHQPQDFDVRLNPPRIQVEERLYYEPCKLCGRPSYDPRCKCVYGSML
jgi:molecular chaperone DnaK (HSP70)